VVPDLARRERPDLLAVYFEAVDACGHLFMGTQRGAPDVADAISRLGNGGLLLSVPDGVLADSTALEGPGTVTIVSPTTDSERRPAA
jgi:hypothetical protein